MKKLKLLETLRNPQVLLRIVVIASFVLILSGLFRLMVQDYKTRELNTQLNSLRVSAARLSVLSKDLLVTDDLANTIEQWALMRTRLETGFREVLENRTIYDVYGSEKDPIQLRHTERLFELLRPRMDDLKTGVDLVQALLGSDLPGLYQIQGTNRGEVVDQTIAMITRFSLYSADLLNQRVQTIIRDADDYGTRSVRLSIAVLLVLSVLVWVIIMFVMNSLNVATRRIKDTNSYLDGALSAVYELSGQGFLSFDESLRVDSHFSHQAGKLVGRDPSGLAIAELLWEEKTIRKDFESGMGIVFGGKARPEVVFDLLEKDVLIGGTNIRLGFRMLPNRTVMVALSDVTREVRLKRIEEEERQRREMIFKVVANRGSFAEFLRESAGVFREYACYRGGADGSLSASEMMRHLHTFKGNAGFFLFRKTATRAHDLEHAINENLVLGAALDIEGTLRDFKETFHGELEQITSFLGAAWLDSLDSIQVPRESFLRIERHIRQKHPDDRTLLVNLMRYRLVPLRELFARFPEMVESLAQQLGKRVSPVQIEGGDFTVLPERFESLVASFVHMIRNMVDHGIEPSYERESGGKLPQGKIRIRLAKKDGAYEFGFADDGRGIDLEKIRARAVERGLIQPAERLDEAQIHGLLFLDGFSTAESVTEVSGRGVGLAAVRAEAERLGGSIEVRSRFCQGWEMLGIFPFNRGDM